MERRIKLKCEKQKELVYNAAKKEGSLKNLGYKLNINYSSLKNYACGQRLIPENIFNKIVKLSGNKTENIKMSYLPSNWGASIGGKKGMEILERKYPKKIIEWRKKGLKKSHSSNTKKIKIPLLNEKLAEFIGAYLGDGTMTKYFIRISGDCRHDKPYFNYLSNLVFELFGITASIKKEKIRNTLYLSILSKEVCSFLNKKFNLKYGHKIRNKTAIPKKIMQDKKLSIACLRGLIDTDGSISKRGKNQFCIQFTSHNKKLLNQTYIIGKSLGIFTFFSDTGAGTNKQNNILKYFVKVGSSNLRHIIRFHLKFYENKTIYQKDLVNYYQKEIYQNLDLPFKIKPVS